jgi:hypothetical protein
MACPDPVTLPPEIRPSGFSFDDHATASEVTDVHVEAYLKSGEQLAPSVTAGADFVRTFGRRAFRRPLTDEEVSRYTAMGDTSLIMQSMLSSPNFLYRSEVGEPQSDGTYALTPYELASALSYFFWGSMPDEALLTAAANGTLQTPQGVEAQARRLLADPRAKEQLKHFSVQWLGVERVLTEDKSPTLFASFDADARQALYAQTQEFFAGATRFEDLFTDGGVLAEGSFLASNAHSDQTSPVLRGLAVRQRLLCQELGTPPPNAGNVPAIDPNATTRERFSQHSSDPACHACHQYLDPVGFGFEQYDAIGQFRTTENGKPIDPSGDLADIEGLGTGTHAPFTTLAQLGALIAASPSAHACMARQMFRFASGYVERPEDACVLKALAGKDDLRELMVAIALNPNFSVRR